MKFNLLKKSSSRLLACLAVCLFASAAHARGVVSLNLCTDQLLVLLAPEQVAALEPLARDPALSFVAATARRLPSVRADAEAVLRLQPHLVLAGRYGAQTTVALLRARGLPVAQFDEPQDFPQIADQITQIATLLGVQSRGRRLVAAMERRLANLPQRIGTAILWQAGGWSAGAGSLGDAVLRQAGLRNIGTGARIGLESLLARQPDWLVTETAPEFPSMATALASHPALAGLPRLQIKPDLLICGGPFTPEAVAALVR